jgi:hypothetical protein
MNIFSYVSFYCLICFLIPNRDLDIIYRKMGEGRKEEGRKRRMEGRRERGNLKLEEISEVT